MVASLTSAPVLTASSFEPLQAESAGETKKGGCTAGILGCCVGVPMGQVTNSGYPGNYGRALIRFLLVGGLLDGVKAYQGETAEEYLGVTDMSKPTGPEKKGGIGAGIQSCCLIGVPGGQLRNSGMEIPSRAWLRLIPYVNGLVWLYDGYKGFSGETFQEYTGTEF